jgi:uncharacterized coiled-coil DUF342 family protein
MLKYKKELGELKRKAEDAAGALLRDDKVSSLQKQIHWFRKEAGVLEAQILEQTRDIQKYELREATVTGDR